MYSVVLSRVWISNLSGIFRRDLHHQRRMGMWKRKRNIESWNQTHLVLKEKHSSFGSTGCFWSTFSFKELTPYQKDDFLRFLTRGNHGMDSCVIQQFKCYYRNLWFFLIREHLLFVVSHSICIIAVKYIYECDNIVV